MKSRLTKYLLLSSFVGTFAETMLTPLYTAMTQKFGGSILDAGIGYGIFSIATGLFVAIVGQTNWFERNIKSMMVWGFAISCGCNYLYLACQNIPEFFCVQVLIGLSTGMLNPAWDALYSEDAEEGTHGKRWSFWTGGINFVTGLAALAGAIIVHWLGFKWLFLVMGGFDIFAVYFAWKAIHEEN